MTQAVMPDGTILEFPDNTPDDVIDRTVRNHLSGMGPRTAVQPSPNPVMEFALAASKGLMRGGPLIGLFGESSSQANKLLEKGAYKAGGAVTDVAAQRVDPETAAKLGFATNVAIQAAPSIIGGKIAEKVFSPVMESSAQRLMTSAMKPTFGDWKSGKAARAIDTMLEEGVLPTKGGVAKLRRHIDDLADEVNQAVAKSPAMINKAKVGQELRDVVAEFKNQVNPNTSLEAIRKSWDEFSNHPLLRGKVDFPVQTAQALKQGSYRALGDKAYGLGLKPEAEREAQKALVRGLRKQIAEAVPEVSAPLARESDLINALKLAQRRAYMESNRNILGLAGIAPTKAGFWAMLADAYGLSKATAAQSLYHGAERVPQTLGMGAIGALMSESGQPLANEPGALYRYLRGYIPPMLNE